MNQALEVRGRTALVTGGSKGIGRAVVEELAGAGAAVWALARDPSPVETLATASGGGTIAADLTDDEALWEAMDLLLEELGGAPDIVVACAGDFDLAALAETSVKQFDRMIEVNLRGTFLVYRVLLPELLKRGTGDVVTVGSVASRRAFPANGAYSASKYGQRGLHEVMAEELRGTGVRATLIEPAATDTPLWDPVDPDSDPHLPGRDAMLRPEDVAQAVSFAVTRPAHVRIPLLTIERG